VIEFIGTFLALELSLEEVYNDVRAIFETLFDLLRSGEVCVLIILEVTDRRFWWLYTCRFRPLNSPLYRRLLYCTGICKPLDPSFGGPCARSVPATRQREQKIKQITGVWPSGLQSRTCYRYLRSSIKSRWSAKSHLVLRQHNSNTSAL